MVTMALSCMMYHYRDKARYWSKIAICFILHLHSTLSMGGDPVTPTIAIKFNTEKLEWWVYQVVKKFDHTFSHFDTIAACDGQTGRRTSCDSIVRAM